MGTIPTVTFQVANALTSYDAVHLQVENAARPVAEVEFTVSRDLLDSWEAPTLWYRADVYINGVRVPENELLLPIEIDDPGIDTHTGGASFTLVGRKWSPWVTDATYSRGTEVTIYLNHGQEGAVIEPAEPDFSGYVLGCDMNAGGRIPQIRVNCGDAFSRFAKYTTCEEIEPFAGMTRMEITELLGGAAGIDYFEGPDGATYTKPVQAINKRLPDVLKALWEPEGCCIRMRGFDTLVVDRPEIKLAPLPADFTWSKRDCLPGGVQAIPPEDCPSRWVVRGTAPVVVDEAGISTETTSQEIWASYAPVTTPTQQNGTTGAITSTGRTAGDPVLRPVRKLVVTTTKRAGKLLTKLEQEYRWNNPKRARLVTNNGGAGTAGGGFDYMPSLIDEQGNFVTYNDEKFELVLERYTINAYSDSGDITSQTVRTSRWGVKTKAVRVVGDSPTVTTVAASYVYSDDQSYDTTSETWGIWEQVDVTYAYDTPAPAPLVTTTQDTYAYQAIRSRIDGASSGTYRILYDGTGQFNENVATWRKVKTEAVTNFLNADKLVTGKSTTTYQYAVPVKVDGTYDYGGGLRSDSQFMTFQLVSIDSTTFNIVNEGQIEEVTYPVTGGRVPRLILGQLPTTLYQGSAWTVVTTEPFEELLDDPTALQWFGFERNAQMHDYVQNPAEARNVIAIRRRTKITPALELTRPDHLAKVGDTIDFSSPEDGINDRFIVVDRGGRQWGAGVPRAKYKLKPWRENVAVAA